MNIKNIIIVFSIVVLVSACAQKLEKLPPQEIANEVALSTEENVDKVLIGAYDALSFTDLFGGEVLRNSELLAADGEIAFTGTFEQPGEIWNKAITTTNSDVSEMWLDGYNAINICNNILSALDVYEDQARRDVVEGEARFIRSLIYFELVKFFGKPYSAGNVTSNLGVPLVTTPTNGVDESSKVSRNTVGEIYDFVRDEMTAAASLLPADNGVFANSVAANTMLARIYLQMADYNAALAAANQALTDANGLYFMNTNFIDAFNNESNGLEDVFTIQVTTQDGANAMQTYYGTTLVGGRGDIDIQAAHLAFYDAANDDRYNQFFDDNGRTRTDKWQNQFANVNTVRLAELYLIRAECNVRLGSSVGDTPSNDLQRTRGRVGLPVIAAPTLDDVLLERKLELAQEGQAIHDFKRTQGAFYALAGGDGLVDGFAYDANELVFPIPDREINVNSNLVQNDGY